MTTSTITLMTGDCLELMASIPDGSVDMVLADLPYGTTQCAWDAVIPFEPLWAHYRRIAKPDAAIVLCAAQPFASLLVASNLAEYRYEWIWEKGNATGFLNAKKQPLRAHETAQVFYRKQPTYNPQKTSGHERKTSKRKPPRQLRSLWKGHHSDRLRLYRALPAVGPVLFQR